MRAILDEAVARAIQAEAESPHDDINRQSAEILKVHRRAAVRSGFTAYPSLPIRRAPAGCSANCRPMRRSSVT